MAAVGQHQRQRRQTERQIERAQVGRPSAQRNEHLIDDDAKGQRRHDREHAGQDAHTPWQPRGADSTDALRVQGAGESSVGSSGDLHLRPPGNETSPGAFGYVLVHTEKDGVNSMDCYFHSNVPSVAPCVECGKPICATCRDERGGCPSCRLAAKVEAATATRQQIPGAVPPRPAPASVRGKATVATMPDPVESRALVALGYPLWPLALTLAARSQAVADPAPASVTGAGL